MSETDFNDDIITFDNSHMKQCISGLGRNALLAADDFSKGRTPENYNAIKCHLDEFVRLCRAFNRELHETKLDRDRLRKMLAMSEPAYLTSISAASPDFPTPQGAAERGGVA